MSLTRIFDQIRLAMMMLTRLPMGTLRAPVPTLSEAAWAFPLAGLLTGGLAWAVLVAGSTLGLAPLLSALLALAAVVWLTGALHEDGLADVADGLGGGHDRARALEIMRDSRIGSYGVVALVFVLGLKAAALSELSPDVALIPLVFAALSSRFAMLALLVWMPPARSDGLGHSAAQPSPASVVPGLLGIAVLAFVMGPESLVMLGAIALGAGVMAVLAYRRLQGQTGDVLGATQNLSETLGLIAASVLFAA